MELAVGQTGLISRHMSILCIVFNFYPSFKTKLYEQKTVNKQISVPVSSLNSFRTIFPELKTISDKGRYRLIHFRFRQLLMYTNIFTVNFLEMDWKRVTF
jgi:hypothetical protein